MMTNEMPNLASWWTCSDNDAILAETQLGARDVPHCCGLARDNDTPSRLANCSTIRSVNQKT